MAEKSYREKYKEYYRIYDDILANEKEIEPGYLVSFRPLKSGYSFLSINTKWVGQDKKHEIRQASLVEPLITKAHFKLLKYPLLIIENTTELTGFLRIGGHAMVTKNVAETNWKEILEPKVVANTYEEGYIDYEIVHEKFKKRYARGNFRIEIFDRDNYQCKICGSSPNDGVHVRLELHHIKPWEEGGITSPENLITLCASCHAGANLFNREVLYRKIGLEFPFVEHKFFKENMNWNLVQRISHTQLLSNAVSLRIKNSS